MHTNNYESIATAKELTITKSRDQPLTCIAERESLVTYTKRVPVECVAG